MEFKLAYERLTAEQSW